MGFTANVLRVLIASPGDMTEARNAVETALHRWNDANATSKQTIFHPWRWEFSAVPQLGAPPQTIINAQAVDDADVVFALFGSRLGTPTPDAVSGTVEEIERAVAQGKPVHLYFSTAPLPHDVDTEQLESLREFKRQIQQRGLLGEFSNPSQLGHEVWKALEFDLTRLDLGVPVLKTATSEPFLVQPQEAREPSGVSKQGKPRYTTRHWIEVTRTSALDAHDVVIEVARENTPLHRVVGEFPTTIHAGQTRSFPALYAWGGSDPAVVRIRWTEDGQPQEREYHV